MHPPDEAKIAYYRDLLTKYQHLSSVALSPIIGASLNTINYYRRLLDLPWTAIVYCACGCGRTFQAQGCRKYALECGHRIAKERRAELRKEEYHRGPIHFEAHAVNGRVIPCLACGHKFLSTGKGNRICDPCKMSAEFSGGLHVHGFGRLGSRRFGGGRMKNRHAPRPVLPRPKKCPVCNAAIAWHTIVYQGKRVDEYRCLNGHETGEIGMERGRG